MKKSELIDRLLKKFPYLYRKDINILVNVLVDEMSNHLANKNRIEIRGFGAFSLRLRQARQVRNPKNNEKLFIDDRYSVYFRQSKLLKNKLND